MAIERSIFNTSQLLGVLRDNSVMEPPSNYWLTLCFGRTINFTDEYVDFSKISGTRKLAPLVVPTAQGRPIYSNAERLLRVKPAYVKPKDPVTATRVIQRAAGFGELSTQTEMTPQQRYNMIVADIMKEHRRAIERRWEWLAAQAIIYGKVILEGEDYPRTLVDFGRDPAHDIVLTSGNRWGDAGVSIIRQIESWKDMARRAKFGGPISRVTIGSAAWAVMREDEEIRELLKLDLRPYNNGVDINLGIREGLDVEYVGNLSGTTPVYVYSDYYNDTDNTVVPFMDPRDVVLTGSNVQGVRCFGAIQDVKANFQALEIFPKMWSQEDPSATFIMNQSAPLMVPVNPNNTIHARVVA